MHPAFQQIWHTAVTCVLCTGDGSLQAGTKPSGCVDIYKSANSLLRRQEVRYLARVVIIRVTKVYTINDIKCKARILL